MKIEELKHQYNHIYKESPECKDKAYSFCENYKKFIDVGKTERECVKTLIELAKKNNYKEFKKDVKLNKYEKIYINNRDKSLVLITIGEKPINEGVNFIVSHIDSPRLDLKANPLYEDTEIAYFKTHYYGGIKKYQWPTIPLAMHGRMYREDGTYIDFNIGENEQDEKFIITDLLPHLSQVQNERKLSDGIKGEELNIIVGSIPFLTDDEKKENSECIKNNILKILNERFNVKEKDFVRSEIEFVPANKSSDIGFDKSLIAAYGQDDRVCAYPAFVAEIENIKPVKTSITVFTDKEEIGSEGNTGMVSNYLFDIISDIAELLDVKERDIYKNSICFSSDVNSAFDPTFSDVYDKNNSSYINRGVVITKFTGHRGKSDSNDASAETMAKVLKLLDKNKVCWQIGELGKVDIGGGGTIAKYMSQRNIDTVDIGVPVLSMHSPYEVTSKLDIYHTYLAYKALLSNEE